MPRKYPEEFRSRAVRLVDEAIAEGGESPSVAMSRVAARLGVSMESVRRWRRQELVDAGKVRGVTSEESAEIRRLRRENRELKRANEILKTASAYFAAELDRPTTK
jgi:transposase